MAGANVDARDRHSATPLHLAAEGGHFGVAVALLQAGADAYALDDRQRSPAASAEDGGHAHLKRKLLSYQKCQGLPCQC